MAALSNVTPGAERTFRLMLWLAQETTTSVSLGAVWIGAGAVIVAALIAAVAADKRLQKTLKAERERSRDQLDAESSRLDRQLAHDRELTDLAELRTLLDSTIANALSLYHAYTDVIQRHEKSLEGGDDLTTELEIDEILERDDEGAREILEREKERMEEFSSVRRSNSLLARPPKSSWLTGCVSVPDFPPGMRCSKLTAR